jgi:HAD superfamily hydrolase (TIGR01509 family)
VTPTDLLPGVARFIAEARALGIRIGLGSASKNARDVLHNLAIAEQFDAVGDGYSVSRSKPAPDLFVWVAGRLDVPPAEAVVFEDAEAGIEAALTAGMYAVGIGPAERVGAAHLRYEHLGDAHVEALLNALPASPALPLPS